MHYLKATDLVCFILVGSAMFGATLNLVTRVGLPIFGTVKDNSLKINSLPIKFGCNNKNVLQNGVNPGRQLVVKNGF